jgi:hypothetical protein
VTTVGWSDCGHDSWRRGLVLDPFCGTGTVLSVALGHGRDAIGIELDERNVALAERRIGGLFLSVERPGEESHDPPDLEPPNSPADRPGDLG